MVVDALSCKEISDLRALFASLSLFDDSSMLAELQVEQRSSSDYTLDQDGILCFHSYYCILKDDLLKHDILQEAYSSPYAKHPSGDKTYKNLKEHYFWAGMKKNILDFVVRCLTYQHVKEEHQYPSGLL
ncbi:uncharacterized protein LOC120193225 [Hibiscus syriacus]|uniref:uncharacterized protein LOC120193225 n=1 Tax=Hibiscus syriacus TaxID=106335 RepID=UPI001920FBAC|nr:uncharacterized protein LOC120193225 [Hibiscus syriacus]